MAKIIHRPKPEVLTAPDYNKVLQNTKAGQQAGVQARAEQEHARSRFEQALQKAVNKDAANAVRRNESKHSQQIPQRSSGDEKTSAATSRTTEKNFNSTPMPGRQDSASSYTQSPLLVRPNQQQPIEKTPETARGNAAERRQVQETNSLQSVAGGSRTNAGCKVAKSDEENVDAASLESMACPSPPSLQEPLPSSAEVAPTGRAGSFHQFETIESMLSHLSLMTARYGSRDWTFEIQNENSALVSVSMSATGNGGWNVAITAKPEDQPDAQRYLDELKENLHDSALVTLNLKDEDKSGDQVSDQVGDMAQEHS